MVGNNSHLIHGYMMEPRESHSGFTSLDRHFGRFIGECCDRDTGLVSLTARLASARTRLGHICTDLRDFSGRPVFDRESEPDGTSGISQYPGFGDWFALLRKSPVVGVPGEFKPLILDDAGRLYLYRYWRYESRLAQSIRSMAAQPSPEVHQEGFKAGILRLFPDSGGNCVPDWQMIACALANTKRFCVISGGPGTGKTSTVVRILALMQEQQHLSGASQPLRILLAAPTGKAAARLSEAVIRSKAELPCDPAIVAMIPSGAATVHRILKPIAGTPDFHHGEQFPLAADVVVLDEASMVDLALMAKLTAAIPPAGRLILLGDKDQLASVEAGSVLGDICGDDPENRYSPGMADRLGRLTGQKSPTFAHETSPLGDCRVQLMKSYRFPDHGMIAKLSRAVNGGNANEAAAMLAAPFEDTVCFHEITRQMDYPALLRKRILEKYAGVLREPDPAAALRMLGRFKILCAVNFGSLGVSGINRFAEKTLFEAGLIHWGAGGKALRETGWRGWYPGRPVLILRNDYRLQLFNGDVGIALPGPEDPQGPLWVFFQGDNGALKRVLPEQVPPHETVFAMTVHKSQGSEFDEVLLILPDKPYPVLTRELIYTGITRAMRRLEIWSPLTVFSSAVKERIRRNSGLKDALWRPSVGTDSSHCRPHVL